MPNHPNIEPCGCGHAARRHADGGDGICMAGSCGCPGFTEPAGEVSLGEYMKVNDRADNLAMIAQMTAPEPKPDPAPEPDPEPYVSKPVEAYIEPIELEPVATVPIPGGVLYLPPELPPAKPIEDDGKFLTELTQAMTEPITDVDTPTDRLPPPGTKRCPRCRETKFVDEFHAQTRRNGDIRRQGWCKACHREDQVGQKKRLTPTKQKRTRARQRATAELLQLHYDEFRVLLEKHQAIVEAEFNAITEAAVKAGLTIPADGIVRLRTGIRLADQGITDRMDVARCPDCARHHDAGHVCEACGQAPSQQATA